MRSSNVTPHTVQLVSSNISKAIRHTFQLPIFYRSTLSSLPFNLLSQRGMDKLPSSCCELRTMRKLPTHPANRRRRGGKYDEGIRSPHTRHSSSLQNAIRNEGRYRTLYRKPPTQDRRHHTAGIEIKVDINTQTNRSAKHTRPAQITAPLPSKFENNFGSFFPKGKRPDHFLYVHSVTLFFSLFGWSEDKKLPTTTQALFISEPVFLYTRQKGMPHPTNPAHHAHNFQQTHSRARTSAGKIFNPKQKTCVTNIEPCTSTETNKKGRKH